LGNGGALVFFDNSTLKMISKLLILKGVKNSLEISKGIFLQNTANLGGGIYIGNQFLTVDSSSFIENSALEGGAIATKASSKIFRKIFSLTGKKMTQRFY